MHPRIKELYELIKQIDPQKILNIEVLHFLKDYGATRTESSITIHLGFGIQAKEVDDFVLQSNVWEHEDVNEVFYQTLKYLYYSDNASDYKADDDSVQISL